MSRLRVLIRPGASDAEIHAASQRVAWERGMTLWRVGWVEADDVPELSKSQQTTLAVSGVLVLHEEGP